MNIVEYKNNVNQIIHFTARINEEHIPDEIKRIMVKVYASTLRINLSDRMADSVIEYIYNCQGTIKQVATAL